MAKTVLSGNRPTGKLHLGHLHGALSNWIKLQDKYDCYFFVADWHALTTAYTDVSHLQEDIYDMVVDWLAAGLNPEKCVIYRQSDISQVAELSLYFSMITPLGWLERSPSYKEMVEELGTDISTHGFLGYPVLQAADILIVHGELVPVGEDQQAHVELAREIARRFNHLYGKCLKEPQTVLTKVKRLPGIDGRKMSKSYGNAIYLSDSPQDIKKKVRMMITDPARIRRTDPGHPEVCLVYGLHQLYSGKDLKDIEDKCRAGKRGCTECKDILAKRITEALADFRLRREEIREKKGLVEKVLEEGAKKARSVAEVTLREVRKRINIEK